MAQDQNAVAGNKSIAVEPLEVIVHDGISIPVYDFAGFKPMLNMTNDTIYVINFWATWCKPCVEELPFFQRLSLEMTEEKIRFIYVSLDFRKNLEKSLIPFIKSKGFPNDVIMLSDPNANSWIDQVDPTWSGAIPATLIYRNGRKLFLEKTLSYDELKSNVQSIINY